MGFIRLIHKQHYDPDKKRFASLAFKPSSDGSGISVVDTDCILRTSSSICEHIERFYRDVSGTPPIFWDLQPQILPENCQLIRQRSSTGDDCHYNLVGLSEKEARAIFKAVPLTDFNICINTEGYRPLSISDLE